MSNEQDREHTQLEICRWLADLRIVLGLTRVVLEDLQALKKASLLAKETITAYDQA